MSGLGEIVAIFLATLVVQLLTVWRGYETHAGLRERIEGACHMASALVLYLLWQAWQGE